MAIILAQTTCHSKKIIVVPRPLTERIKELRQEIAELTEKNRRYSLGPKYGSAAADNARRFLVFITYRKGIYTARSAMRGSYAAS